MKINPSALVLWGVTTIIGYLIGGSFKAALVGLLVGLCISLLAEAIPTRRRW